MRLVMSAPLTIKDGDLLDQMVEGIVNAWHRNLIPGWLLSLQGVPGASKRRGGDEPFRADKIGASSAPGSRR
jgi:hypothetical protein